MLRAGDKIMITVVTLPPGSWLSRHLPVEATVWDTPCNAPCKGCGMPCLQRNNYFGAEIEIGPAKTSLSSCRIKEYYPLEREKQLFLEF